MSDEAGCDSQLTGLTLSAGLASLPLLHDIQAESRVYA